MLKFSRADNSAVARWWMTVDRWTLGALMLLIGCGCIMVLAASPSVAERVQRSHEHFSRESFIIKQFVFLLISIVIMLLVSMMPVRVVRQLAVLGCGLAFVATAATLLAGAEAKGAARWISIAGNRIQPSEFLKPCFALTAAWLIARSKLNPKFHGTLIAMVWLALIIAILKKQPDVGMMAVIAAVFMIQLFISGINMLWIAPALLLAGSGGALLFFFDSHVHDRVMKFWNGKNYQIDRVMEAFANGGLLGRGAGEGVVKDRIPDVHADVVFAVVGEEFGMIVSILVVAVFAFIVLRGLLRLMKEPDLFHVLACGGLISGFGLQAMINLFSTLGMMPTKGMTLPFISYGGSSAVAVGLGMGMLLSLTRVRTRDERAATRVTGAGHAGLGHEAAA